MLPNGGEKKQDNGYIDIDYSDGWWPGCLFGMHLICTFHVFGLVVVYHIKGPNRNCRRHYIPATTRAFPTRKPAIEIDRDKYANWYIRLVDVAILRLAIYVCSEKTQNKEGLLHFFFYQLWCNWASKLIKKMSIKQDLIINIVPWTAWPLNILIVKFIFT